MYILEMKKKVVDVKVCYLLFQELCIQYPGAMELIEKRTGEIDH